MTGLVTALGECVLSSKAAALQAAQAQCNLVAMAKADVARAEADLAKAKALLRAIEARA